MGDVDHILAGALDANCYYDKSYFAVPDGFALVTRLEQIYPDGTSKMPPARWLIGVASVTRFSLKEYLEVLSMAPPGDYRVIVFIVTSHPFSQSHAEVSQEQALQWLEQGFERLPSDVGELEFTQDYGCTALVYEFTIKRSDQPPHFEFPSHLQGRSHLEKVKIWLALSS